MPPLFDKVVTADPDDEDGDEQGHQDDPEYDPPIHGSVRFLGKAEKQSRVDFDSSFHAIHGFFFFLSRCQDPGGSIYIDAEVFLV